MKDLLEMTVPETTPVTAASKPMKGLGKKILLADDDAGVRQILVHLLQEEGYEVLTAATGPEALAKAGAAHFDLVILDLNLQVKEGEKAFEQITSQNPLLPIILITAEPNQRFHAMASGVVALVEKPFDFVQLFDTIHELLAEPEAVRRAQIAARASVFRFIPSKPEAADEEGKV